jgi:very-short-patch-repair endonuclease
MSPPPAGGGTSTQTSLPPKGGSTGAAGEGGTRLSLASRNDDRMARPLHTPIAGARAKAMRRSLTVSEARVWGALKNKATGARFRRQVSCGHWIADFCSFAPRLVIEIDDTSHEFRDESIRTQYFESLGFPVLRFTSKQVAQELPEVVGTITAWVAPPCNGTPTRVSPSGPPGATSPCGGGNKRPAALRGEKMNPLRAACRVTQMLVGGDIGQHDWFPISRRDQAHIDTIDFAQPEVSHRGHPR